MDNKFAKLNLLLDDESILVEDIDYFGDKLTTTLGFFDHLSNNRKIALIAATFLWGVKGLIERTNLLLALESEDYERAATELMRDNGKFAAIANAIKTDVI